MENTMMSNGLRRLLIIFGVLLVVSLLASGFSAVYVTLAAPQRSTYVPTTIGFEGQLADSQGSPVEDGSYSISFSLYNAATGGSPVWSETQPSIQVKDGLYSVQLGSITEFEADDFSGPRWLGVKVGSDAEMEPRISVGAVPFALNAKYAAGLQDNPVADTAPETDDALMWTGSQWAPQGMTFPDLAPVGSNASPNDLLANYRSGAILRWKTTDTVEVSAGELMINGKMRRNTVSADITFVDHTPESGITSLGLVGDPQSNKTYDVYAVADSDENNFDFIISESPNAPTGVTNYRKLGSFRTVPNSTNIVEGSAVNLVGDPSSLPRRAFGFHLNSKVVSGSPVLCGINSPSFFGHFCHQQPPANGNTFTNGFMLKAGTYTLYLLGWPGANRGKIDWYLDSVVQTSGQDWYDGIGNYPNTVKSVSLNVTYDGYHVLKGVVNGKNVNSYDYFILITEWWIAPTSD